VSSRSVPGELALIEAIRRRARSASRALRLGIGDDCAVLRPKTSHEICVTTDLSLEGTHFRRDWHPPESIGHRCLARGLSDLAAMGAEPVAVFLSLAVPRRLAADWVDRFLTGFLALAKKLRVPLAGGDTAESPSISQGRGGLIAADIVAVGQVPRGGAVLRSGARSGDIVYVTGTLGGAAAELLALSRYPRKFGKLTDALAGHPHLFPEPRVAVGRRLRELANAMIDVSDGLSTDLTHLCQLAAESRSVLELALHGGEDYELLFTASPQARIPRKMAEVPIHRIGVMRKASRGQRLVVLKSNDGRHISLEPVGWEHFR
jgi:thiamine-monophosphate kinase